MKIDTERKLKLMACLGGINQRCRNPKSPHYHLYGERGIKNFLTIKDIYFLWERDKAWKMNQPCLGRINHDGNYEIKNVRYIEKSINSGVENPFKWKGRGGCKFCGADNPRALTKFCSRKCAMNSARLAWLERNKKSKGGSK